MLVLVGLEMDIEIDIVRVDGYIKWLGVGVEGLLVIIVVV